MRRAISPEASWRSAPSRNAGRAAGEAGLSNLPAGLAGPFLLKLRQTLGEVPLPESFWGSG